MSLIEATQPKRHTPEQISSMFTGEVPVVLLQYPIIQDKSTRKQIRQSSDAYDILIKCFNPRTMDMQEEFWILCLNQANKVIAANRVSIGGISGCVVDVKLVMSAALLTMSSGIVLAHNHPSGNLNPSKQDIEITKKIKEASKYLDIAILDHIILTSSCGYTSLADEGLM